MVTQAQKHFVNIEEMSEHQVRNLMDRALARKDFDVVEALEEELERRGVILEGGGGSQGFF
ncbi:MAG: hypothetical protein HQ512_00570 [Rhodospirillales bacterium]|nr:hypothetical protein [Rhodospirillales bacterium]